MAPVLHFVIVTYNGTSWIRRCLESLNVAAPDAKVHIIDNCSNDQTVSICKELGFDVVREKENLGFGKANNKGISKALSQGATHVFLLNQDAYLKEDAISHFFEHTVNPELPILHAFMQLNGAGDDYDVNFKQTYLKETNCPGFETDSAIGVLREGYPIHFANAAAWMLPVSLINMIGGFNPSFFHYGEDDNYIERLRFHGVPVLLRPNCIVYHDRENRKANPYFEDKRQKQRSFLIKISSPERSSSSFHTILSLCWILLKKIIRFNRPSTCIELLQLQFLRENPISKIICNRELSKVTNGPFL